MTIKDIKIIVEESATSARYEMSISLSDLTEAVKKDALWLYIKGNINAIDAIEKDILNR